MTGKYWIHWKPHLLFFHEKKKRDIYYQWNIFSSKTCFRADKKYHYIISFVELFPTRTSHLFQLSIDHTLFATFFQFLLMKNAAMLPCLNPTPNCTICSTFHVCCENRYHNKTPFHAVKTSIICNLWYYI